MTTQDFITELFCRIDDEMRDIAKHSQAKLWPSEVTTLAVLHALKGVGSRAFYRWLSRDYRMLFPALPERSRLMRSFKTHWRWAQRFLAQPSLLAVIDTYGIELLHPRREGRRYGALAAKGYSNHRWIMGIKWGVVLNHLGLIVRWAWAPANTHDQHFQPLIKVLEDQSVVFGDQGFHAADGDPSNYKLCHRGEQNQRMVVETVFSMLTGISHLKKVAHRVDTYLRARLAFTVAAFNLLVQWYGLQPNEDGFVPLSIAEFNL